MADRTMFQGDTWPPLRGEAKDETGVLDLTAAASLLARIRAPNPSGGFFLISGAAVPDTPPIADEDGVHFWNWHYVWQTGDTAQIAADYNVELVVTWAVGEIQTYSGPTLAIVAPLT